MKWAERCLQCNHFLAGWKVEAGVNFCNSKCLHTYLEDKGQTDLVGEGHESEEQETVQEGQGPKEVLSVVEALPPAG